MPRFKQSDFDALSPAPEQITVDWLVAAESATEFLKANAIGEEILIYGQNSSALIHGVLAPIEKVTPPDADDLQNRNIPMGDDAWAVQRAWGGGEGRRIYLEPPLASSGSASFRGGEKLIFRRSFTGVDKASRPIELSQKLIHSLDLYFVAERNAYCRLDPRGDIDDVIRVIQHPGTGPWNELAIVTILRKDLDLYMTLSNAALVLRFDFTRVRWGSFGGWGEIKHFNREETDLFYHGGSDGQGSFINGAIIIRPRVTVADLVRQWEEEEDPNRRKYATFKIYDRKNNREVETSCASECLSNYFQKSNLPWEISPAFFRPEVLHRFKADAEKYTLEDRSISCRGTWHLKTYDINSAGQVHTYIGYLADLPYEEQLYWQAFNEWPKGPISDRAHQTDIVGDWYGEYDPLSSLKHAIHRLDTTPSPWWIVRGEQLAASVLYPASDSPQGSCPGRWCMSPCFPVRLDSLS
jgi:hypothetical protein